MKGGTNTKILAKIQVTGIFRIRDIRRNVLPTGSQCGFCGCVALSTALKLQFCSYKHVFFYMIGGPKN